MCAKYLLNLAGVIVAGLMLARPSFAQTNLSLAVEGAPLPASDWENRFQLITNQDAFMQAQSLEELAATFPQDQIPVALDKLVLDYSDPARTLIYFLAPRWATNSPANATKWAEARLPGDIFGHNVLNKLVVLWAGKDLSTVVEWLQTMPAGENKSAAALALATETARMGNALTAIDLATNIPPGTERDDLLTYSVQQWAVRDRVKAVAWIKKSPDSFLREKMLGQVALNFGALDPAGGTKFVALEMSDGEYRDNAMANVIRFWAASMPADAAAWVKQLPEGALRDLAMENLLETWGRKNRTDATEWLDKLPAGHVHDVAANALAHLAK